MKKLLINNRGVLKDLDLMAQQVLRHPSTFRYTPPPNVSMARLKQVMDADDGTIEESNGVDYAGRHFHTHEYRYYPSRKTGVKTFSKPEPCVTKYNFLGWLRQATNNKAWEMDTWEIQPEYHGWTPWHSGKNKPINFVRFIWNSGVGITNYVSDGKHYKYRDSKYTGQKNWNCLVGKLDGRQYLSDRNIGNHKRVIIQFSLPSKYTATMDEFVNILSLGNKQDAAPGVPTSNYERDMMLGKWTA